MLLPSHIAWASLHKIAMCPGSIPVAVIKYPDKGGEKEEKVYLSYSYNPFLWGNQGKNYHI